MLYYYTLVINCQGNKTISDKKDKMLITLTQWFFWQWGRGFEWFKESSREEAIRYQDKEKVFKYTRINKNNDSEEA